MARDDDEEVLGTDEKVRRSVARTLANWTVVIVSLGVIAGWAVMGIYELQPGEAAVVLRVGRFDRNVVTPGLKWHLPPPLETVAILNISEIRKQEFGGVQHGAKEEPEAPTYENAIQTADSNIVNLNYEVQYRIQDPFSYVYGIADPEDTLRDAAQAAVREVVGRTSVDGVLSEERGEVQREAEKILQATLDGYFEGTGHEGPFLIESVNLQNVQPPPAVQAAFRDVTAAQQDQARALSSARGDAREILERANAEAIELRESAEAYKQTQVLEAQGRASRFEALLAEYRRAPDVTRRRLYLETMESVLPGVEKVIVEPGTVQLMPFLGLPPSSPRSAPPPAPAPAPAAADGASAPAPTGASAPAEPSAAKAPAVEKAQQEGEGR